MRYTISEMASLLGVTTHTLRYYEKMGLIRPEVNEETGYRYYTVTDTRRFNLCRELRAAELSLEECRELIGSPSVEQSDEMFARQAARLRRRQVLDELSIRFLEKMQEWWKSNNTDNLEYLTGFKTSDFPSANSGQTFSEAADEWWNGKNYDEKRNIYLTNN